VLNPDASWNVAGIADFNADGMADVLWRQTGGGLSLWQMGGSTVTASKALTYNGSAVAPDASWNVAAVGDFNADGEGGHPVARSRQFAVAVVNERFDRQRGRRAHEQRRRADA